MPTASTSFGPLTITHDERVLRPRAWTRAQSEWAAELATSAPEGPALELCSGAGQIGLLLAMLSGRRVVAVDVDPVAGELAEANARVAGLADRVEVRVGPMDAVLAPEERFALVVADPPWVPRAEVGRFPEDPVRAIDGGEDGLQLARHCLAVAEHHLLPGGPLVLQLGTTEQAERLLATLPTGLVGAGMRTYDDGVLLGLSAPR